MPKNVPVPTGLDSDVTPPTPAKRVQTPRTRGDDDIGSTRDISASVERASRSHRR